MNAPDKIYLATNEELKDLDGNFAGIAHSTPTDIIEPLVYIRRDVLLERTKEQKKDCERVIKEKEKPDNGSNI